VRFLYVLGVIGLAASVLVNLASLLGHDLVGAVIFIIWPSMILLSIALQTQGFYTPQRSPGAAMDPFLVRKDATYSHLWVMRKLPAWTRYPVYLCWAFSLTGVLATQIYLWNNGEVHGDPPKIYASHSQPRLATPAEVRRDEESAAFFFSSIAASGFIFPALYFFFERDEPRDENAKTHDDENERA
jgi:hypothetical protein